jgi:alcohol dehydrogenase
MKIRAAVLEIIGTPAPYAQSQPLKIRKVELDPPGTGEVLIRIRAAGLCHSDLSVISGDRPRPVPMFSSPIWCPSNSALTLMQSTFAEFY